MRTILFVGIGGRTSLHGLLVQHGMMAGGYEVKAIGSDTNAGHTADKLQHQGDAVAGVVFEATPERWEDAVWMAEVIAEVQGPGFRIAIYCGRRCTVPEDRKFEPFFGSNEVDELANFMFSDRGSDNRPRILLVDDEEDSMVVAACVLKDSGFSVTAATSAQEAVAMIEKDGSSFCAVITDMSMGGDSSAGLAVCKAARKAGVVVIVVSGFNKPPDYPDPWLEKPYDMEVLISHLEETILVGCSD